MRTFFLISTLLLFTFFLNAQNHISLDSVFAYNGQQVKICDKITDIYHPLGENKNIYINFGGKYPDHKFTVVIFPKDIPNFPYTPEIHLKDKEVCVIGKITLYKEKPQIIANKPEQIEIK